MTLLRLSHTCTASALRVGTLCLTSLCLGALFLSGCAVVRTVLPFGEQTPEPYELIEVPTSASGAFGFARKVDPLPSKGTLNALVIFAQFRDEAGDSSVPDYAGNLFDAELPGSFAHFYDTMSFGQLQIRGRSLPKRYTSPLPKSGYVTKRPGERGRYADFVEDILELVDADIDFGEFDGDEGRSGGLRLCPRALHARGLYPRQGQWDRRPERVGDRFSDPGQRS
jgi:hypothetical protein